MTILITGGAGYIGSHLCEALYRKDKFLVYDDLSSNFGLTEKVKENLIIGDILDKQKLENIFKNYQICTVIHLAANKSVSDSIFYPDKFNNVNINGTENILQMCRKYKIRKLIFSSTAAVYHEKQSKLKENDELKPKSIYGMSKLEAEKRIIQASEAGFLSSIIFRFFNVTGSASHNLEEQNANNLIPIIKLAIQNNSVVNVRGLKVDSIDGSAVRDYVHVMDIANALIAALKYLDNEEISSYEIINLGSERGLTVLEVVELISQLYENTVKVNRTDLAEGEIGFSVCDSSKALELLDWRPTRNPFTFF